MVISLTLSTLPFGPISGFLAPFSTAAAGKPTIRVNRGILEKDYSPCFLSLILNN